MAQIKTLSVHHPHNHPLHPSKPGWKIPPSAGSEYCVIVFIIELLSKARLRSSPCFPKQRQNLISFGKTYHYFKTMARPGPIRGCLIETARKERIGREFDFNCNTICGSVNESIRHQHAGRGVIYKKKEEKRRKM